MFDKKHRIAAISAMLACHPGTVFSLEYFCGMFGAAKSSISEDLSIIKSAFEKTMIGRVSAVQGKKGGISYTPFMPKERADQLRGELIAKMCDPSRILPGGYLYLADLFCTPKYVDFMALMIAEWFYEAHSDLIVTVETKGIPLAMSVAKILNIPMTIARKTNKVTDGAVYCVNYLSGSSRRLQTMSLSKRVIQEYTRALIVDDFIRGGGTVKAIKDMLAEFGIEVAGAAAAIVNRYPKKKQCGNYRAIFRLEELTDIKVTIVPEED